MEKSKVAVLFCDSYGEDKVYSCIKSGIELLDGLDKFISKEEKVLVKPNFLSPSEADSSVVTHPSVIKAMLRLLSEQGYGQVKYGDSPGHGSCKAAAAKIGLNTENTYGARLADMNEEVKVAFPEGKT